MLIQVDAIVLNPNAGGRRAGRHWHQIVQSHPELRRVPIFASPHKVDALFTELTQFLSDRAEQGARRFLAVGGDGTVSWVLNALFAVAERLQVSSSEFCLGAIGLGSSNDFHKPLQSSLRKRIAGLPARVEFARTSLHDVGLARFREPLVKADRYFLINASIGVTAEANDCFNTATGWIGLLKRGWSSGAILATTLTTFRKYQNLHVTLRVADEARHVCISNLGLIKNKHFAGSFRYDVGPAIDDGLLALHLALDMNKMEMLSTLSSLGRGRFTGLPKTTTTWVSSCELESDRPFAFEADGEIVRTTSARIDVVPSAIEVCP